MGNVRLTERVAAPFAGCRVDREAGVIHGALICGPASKNGNDYSRDSFGDLRQYEGRHVYLNHARDRKAEDKIGWFENVRRRDDGMPVGDFHVLRSHPAAGGVFEAAERNPALFGFSHVAVCQTKRVGGRQQVESVERVESIDLVAEPATTRGLFEGVAVATTLGELVESVGARLGGDRRRDARRWLVEMDGDGLLDAPAGEMPAAETDPDEALWSGFQAAMQAVMEKYKSGELDAADAAKEVRKYLMSHKRLMGQGEKSSDDAPAEAPAESSESVRLKADNDRLLREAADLRVRLLAAEKGVRLTEEQAEALAALPTDDKRRRLLESFAPPVAEKPVAAGRTTAAELLKGTAKVEESSRPATGRPVWDAERNKLVLN